MWTAYALANLGENISNIQEAFHEVHRVFHILMDDADMYMLKHAWEMCDDVQNRSIVLRELCRKVSDIIEDEHRSPQKDIYDARCLLEEMKMHSFLHGYMELLMDHMLYRDCKEFVDLVSYSDIDEMKKVIIFFYLNSCTKVRIRRLRM